MDEFSSGDIVICEKDFLKELTMGEKYLVIETKFISMHRCIKILNDNGFVKTFSSQFFKLDILSNRNNNIDKILE